MNILLNMKYMMMILNLKTLNFLNLHLNLNPDESERLEPELEPEL